MLIFLQQLLIFLLNHLVATHDCGVTILYRLEKLVLHVHVLTKLRVRRGLEQPTEDILHVSITLIIGIVKLYHLPVVLLFVGLVKHAEHLEQSVVDLSVQEGDLYDDAVMDETVDKGVGKALSYLMPVVIIRLVVDIKHGYVYISNPVPENIYGNHRNAVGWPHFLVHHVLFVGILSAEILPKA